MALAREVSMQSVDEEDLFAFAPLLCASIASIKAK
jgi:hypothetical protein